MALAGRDASAGSVLSCCPRSRVRSTSTRIHTRTNRWTEDAARRAAGWRWPCAAQEVQVRILYPVGPGSVFSPLLETTVQSTWCSVILLAPPLSFVVWGGEVQRRVSRRCSGRICWCGLRSSGSRSPRQPKRNGSVPAGVGLLSGRCVVCVL